MEVILLPLDEATHSLFMKRPVGWVYFKPLGAVSWIVRSDIVDTGRRKRSFEMAVFVEVGLRDLEKRERGRENI